MSKVSLAACAALVIGAVPASACEGDTRVTVNRPATLQGTLKTGKGEHDAQGPFEYVYLALDKPVCVDAPPATPGDEDAPQSIEAPVDKVQIAGQAINKKLPIGSRVSVEGTRFSAHTMWHVEPVLIDTADVTPK
ncbi:MAG TPA: hypothetical protein VIG38_14030 [Hyphomicrobium sp.]